MIEKGSRNWEGNSIECIRFKYNTFFMYFINKLALSTVRLFGPASKIVKWQGNLKVVLTQCIIGLLLDTVFLVLLRVQGFYTGRSHWRNARAAISHRIKILTCFQATQSKPWFRFSAICQIRPRAGRQNEKNIWYFFACLELVTDRYCLFSVSISNFQLLRFSTLASRQPV